MSYKCDPWSYLAAILFCGSGIIRTVLFDQPLSVEPFDSASWTNLEGDYLEGQYKTERSLISVLWICFSVMHVLAWMIVATLLFRFAWIQSANGTTKIGVNVTIGFVGATTAVVELLVRMLYHGSTHAQQWIAKDFTLEKWSLLDVNTEELDHIGWKTLEVVSIASAGFLLWADTIEYMALVVILVLMHNSSTVDGSLFSKKWAFFGVLIACLNVFDIAAEILRFNNWFLFGHIALYISSANQIVFFPIWLIWMGVQLEAAPKFMPKDNMMDEAPEDLQLSE